MVKGTVIENSLADTSFLDNVQIIKTWKSGSWTLHDVNVEENVALEMGKYLADGPWYVHFWKQGTDDILVVFKHQNFRINHSDTSTWSDAINYGISVGIPEEQLNFVIS